MDILPKGTLNELWDALFSLDLDGNDDVSFTKNPNSKVT